MERARHIAFKIKKNLIVAGGYNKKNGILNKCEKYDIKEGIWMECLQLLPFRLHSAVSATSKDESFAIITGGISSPVLDGFNKSILIYTEKKGFKVFRDISMEHFRIDGVAILI